MSNDRQMGNSGMDSMSGNRQLGLMLAPQAEPEDSPLHERQPVAEYIEVRALSPQPYPSRYVWGCGWGGVMRWDITPSQTSYKVWRKEHGLFDGEPTSILAQEDRIVVGHPGGGLSLSGAEGRTWTVIPTAFPVRALISDGEKITLALCDNGLFNIDLKKTEPTPDVPLAGAIIAGQPWIGTATGLYAYDGHEWKRWLSERMITHVAAANGAVWAAWTDGVVRIAPDGRVSRYEIEHRAVQGIARSAGQTYLLVSEKLYVIEDSGNVQEHPLPKGVSLIAANDQQLVYGSLRQLRWQYLDTISSSRLLIGEFREALYALGVFLDPTSPLPSRELIPKRRAPMPQNVWSTVDTQTTLWAQTTSGELWRQSHTSHLWEKLLLPLHVEATAPLRGVVELNGTTLICLEGSRHGLGILEGTQIVFKSDIKYPHALTLEQDMAHVETADGSYQSADGMHWVKV